MTKNTATYLLTPPQREAVTELALAYAQYIYIVGNERHRMSWPEASMRLRKAQDALGIQLIPNHALIAEAA